MTEQGMQQSSAQQSDKPPVPSNSSETEVMDEGMETYADAYDLAYEAAMHELMGSGINSGSLDRLKPEVQADTIRTYVIEKAFAVARSFAEAPLTDTPNRADRILGANEGAKKALKDYVTEAGLDISPFDLSMFGSDGAADSETA